MEAQEIMSPKVYVVFPEETVAHVRNMMVKHKIACLPVIDNNKPIGIITDRDLAEAFFTFRKPIDDIKAKTIMSKAVLTVKPNTKVNSIARTILNRRAHAVIVYDEQVMGIITKTDITSYFAQNCKGIIRVKDIMEKHVKKVKSQQSIFHALKEMEKNNIEQLIVWEPPVYGIISQKDIALSTFGLRPKRIWRTSNKRTKRNRSVIVVPLTIGDVMKTNVVTIPPSSDAATAARLMLRRKIGSVVVAEKDKLKGIITKTDIVRYVAAH